MLVNSAKVGWSAMLDHDTAPYGSIPGDGSLQGDGSSYSRTRGDSRRAAKGSGYVYTVPNLSLGSEERSDEGPKGSLVRLLGAYLVRVPSVPAFCLLRGSTHSP